VAGTGEQDRSGNQRSGWRLSIKADHINLLWAKLLVEELARNGVNRICIAPGSRSTPITLAAAENTSIETVVHYDERGAAFYALGFARATGRPAVVICTSGTAVANCLPAVVEADQSCVPLIIISADRPPELLDTGALQTIDQTGIFGKYARWAFTLPTPDESITPAFVLTTVDQACYRAIRSPAGAVHLNCMFREPLSPTGTAPDWSKYLSPIQRWTDSCQPFTTYAFVTSGGSFDPSSIASVIANSKKGIIVAGTLPSWKDKSSMFKLAEKLGWPVFADICSGLRSNATLSENLLCHHDLYLRIHEVRTTLSPDCILQFGGTPISKNLLRYLADSRVRWIVVNDNPFRQDVEHVVSDRIEADPIAFATCMAEGISGNQSALTEMLTTAEHIAGKVLRDLVAAQPTQPLELAVAREVFLRSRDLRGVYLATSMPIRDAEAGVSQSDILLPVAANRGVNGIDGTIASAVGFADGLQLPVTLIVGDLALLHDLNSLVLTKRSQQPIAIVVINNNGGGIFSFLPIAETKGHFESYFGTPHGMSFEKIAGQFGLPYRIAPHFAEFQQQLSQAYASGESQLIEVVSDRELNLSQHQQLWQKVADEIRIGLTLS
jgi:2-succinyl-5-enolpyruvyl-6-hydroxy-3-cyclohexene-1-carboxylate synthase